jgi:hypothetical protein
MFGFSCGLESGGCTGSLEQRLDVSSTTTTSFHLHFKTLIIPPKETVSQDV